MLNVMRISEADNLIVALSDLKAGQSIDTPVGEIKIVDDVPAKHKFTTCDVAVGGTLSMYGITIGKAVLPLKKGQRISVENVHHSVSPYEVRPSHFNWKKPCISKWLNRSFDGYHRADGQVGTRNYWLCFL
jgi:altronate hydrolase